MPEFQLSLPKPPSLQEFRQTGPGGSLSRNVLDDVNSAGSHLPNRGRQHTLQVEKTATIPGHSSRAGGAGRRTEARARQKGGPQKQIASYSCRQHTQRARRPPAPQPGGLLSHQDPECHRQKESRVSQRMCVSCQLRRH